VKLQGRFLFVGTAGLGSRGLRRTMPSVSAGLTKLSEMTTQDEAYQPPKVFMSYSHDSEEHRA
jgi:hypothetical protein